MYKNVLIISTSPRKDSNSEILAKEFARGAGEAGNHVEIVSLADKTINFCKGCLACQKLGRCVIEDDANAVTQKMLNAEVIVWATPIYYYEMSGQMKTMIDRANALFSLDYKFREVYLIGTAAENEKGAVDGAVHGLEGWIACFERAKLCGVVRGVGVDAPGSVRESSEALKEAYEMGKNV